MKSYKEQTFLAEFKSFLDEHVDCRLGNLQTEDNRTANHEDRTGDLESKTEDLESKTKILQSDLIYLEDRISELETDGNRLEQEVQALVDSRIKHLVLAGDLHLSINTRNKS